MTMIEVAPSNARDAVPSIVLVGNRKTGKSTLAVIVSASLGRRLVDFDAFFRQKTGLRRQQFKQERGAAEFHTRQLHLLQELLWSSPNGFVIVCPADDLRADERHLLKLFAQTHPVIQVVSDLKPLGDASIDALQDSYHDVKSCSNFEYYNLCEGQLSAGYNSPQRTTSLGHSFLRLKRVEQDFLAFLRHVERRVADEDPVTTKQSPFTYALTLHLSSLPNIKTLEGAFCDGADAVEIRIDPSDPSWVKFSFTDILESVSRGVTLVRRTFQGPIIYHVQKPCAPNQLAWTQLDHARAQTYIDLLHRGLRLCPDYLTVDLGFDDGVIKEVVTSRGSTRIIAHYHDESPGPDGWANPDRMDHFNRAKSLGCHIVRLTQAANSMADNVGAQQFSNLFSKSGDASPRLIAYNTGPLGRLSAFLNQLYTPIRLPPCHDPGSKLPGPSSLEDPRFDLRQAQKALYSAFVLDEVCIYSIGTDVSASLSPAMYRGAFKHLGMPHIYRTRNMASIAELEELIADDKFGGSAIAQGHKMTVLPHVSHMSPHAKIIGAVNTLVPIRCIWKSGQPEPLEFWRGRSRAGPIKGLYGDNTDWVGVIQSIAKRLSPANAVNAKTTGLVMGAGGMARAAIYGMIQLGVRHIFVCNRTIANAQRLADHYNKLTVTHDRLLDAEGNRAPLASGKGWSGNVQVHVIGSLQDAWPQNFAYPTMIVCCVRAPLEAGKPQPVVTIPPQWLKSPNGGVVVETSYDTLLSPLIRQMRGHTHRGWVVVDGLHLLPEQAAAQFELFTGRKSPYIRMCIEVLRNYKSEPDEETREEIRIRLAELYSRLGHVPE